jgi:hypothetical protein
MSSDNDHSLPGPVEIPFPPPGTWLEVASVNGWVTPATLNLRWNRDPLTVFVVELKSSHVVAAAEPHFVPVHPPGPPPDEIWSKILEGDVLEMEAGFADALAPPGAGIEWQAQQWLVPPPADEQQRPHHVPPRHRPLPAPVPAGRVPPRPPPHRPPPNLLQAEVPQKARPGADKRPRHSTSASSAGPSNPSTGAACPLTPPKAWSGDTWTSRTNLKPLPKYHK